MGQVRTRRGQPKVLHNRSHLSCSLYNTPRPVASTPPARDSTGTAHSPHGTRQPSSTSRFQPSPSTSPLSRLYAYAANIALLQVGEPTLRETLPPRRADRADDLSWAVKSFKLATSGITDQTQVHTPMCYAEFGDVLDAIVAMDADGISLEAARSGTAIVDDLTKTGVPDAAEFQALLARAANAFPAETVGQPKLRPDVERRRGDRVELAQPRQRDSQRVGAPQRSADVALSGEITSSRVCGRLDSSSRAVPAPVPLRGWSP